MIALTVEQLLQSIWAALRRIEDNMALPPAPLELPAPTVTVLPPDLTDVVEAVNGLRPGASADDIARALAEILSPQPVPAELPGIADFNAAVKELSWRLKGVGAQAYGGGAVSFAPGQLELLAGAVAATPTTESRLDYDVRTDTQPVYVGHAAAGTATSAAAWTIEKVTYVADRPTRKQVLTGSWDGRTALNW